MHIQASLLLPKKYGRKAKRYPLSLRILTRQTEQTSFISSKTSKKVKTKSIFNSLTPCGFESDMLTLTLVRDTSPPEILSARLNNDAAYSTASTVALTVDAVDVLSDTLEMQWGVCLSGESDCTPLDSDASNWTPYVPYVSVPLSEGDGTYRLGLQLRDASHNETGVVERSVTLDTVAPADVGLVIGNGAGAITQATQVVTVLGSGITEMQLGFQSGLSGILGSRTRKALRLLSALKKEPKRCTDVFVMPQVTQPVKYRPKRLTPRAVSSLEKLSPKICKT